MRYLLTAFLLGLVTTACDRTADPEMPPVEPVSNQAEKADEVTLRGCVAATGRPDMFLLSVSEREIENSRDDATGSVVPRPGRSPLPPGTAGKSSPATRPRPGYTPPGETTAFTLETDVYELVGNGGLNLSEHLGHTIDVTGTFADTPESRGATPGEAPSGGSFIVRTAAHAFDDCVPQLRK